MLRQRSLIGIHVLTGTNALHYAFQTCGQDESRRLLLLQAAAYVPYMHDEAMHPHGASTRATISSSSNRYALVVRPTEPRPRSWLYAPATSSRPRERCCRYCAMMHPLSSSMPPGC